MSKSSLIRQFSIYRRICVHKTAWGIHTKHSNMEIRQMTQKAAQTFIILNLESTREVEFNLTVMSSHLLEQRFWFVNVVVLSVVVEYTNGTSNSNNMWFARKMWNRWARCWMSQLRVSAVSPWPICKHIVSCSIRISPLFYLFIVSARKL